MTDQPLYREEDVVARLRYPLPAGGLHRLVKALEKLYGHNLYIPADGNREWMTIYRKPARAAEPADPPGPLDMP